LIGSGSHAPESAGAGSRARCNGDAEALPTLDDRLEAALGDEAQVKRARHIDLAGCPAWAAGRSQIELLPPELQRDPLSRFGWTL